MLTNYDIAENLLKVGVPLVAICNKDELPEKRYDGCYVINLENATDSKGAWLDGTHWTAFYIEGKKAAYFDSFGFVPPQSVQSFLSPYKPYLWSDKEIQNINSGVCGSYVEMFLIWMYKHREIAFEKRYDIFLNKFSDEPSKNRVILEKMLKPY